MTATVIRQMFGSDTHAEIVRYLRDIGPILPKNRDDEFCRYYVHNSPFFVSIHRQIAEYASQIFGEPVKPSYSFLSLYEPGGICPIHIDRPQCRYTIDYLIEQTSADPWPIYISDPITEETRERLLGISRDRQPTEGPEFEEVYAEAENWTGYDLRPDDAICYSGTHSIHYRDRLPSGRASLIFWHFVPVAFTGDLG